MKRSFLTLLAAALAGSAGCELVSSVDRTKIDGSGGSGGTGGVASSSSSSSGGGTGGMSSSSSSGGGTGGMSSSSSSGGGTGGVGGMPECTQDTDCTPTGDDCVVAVCNAGTCGTANAAAMTPTSSQTSADCMENVCDGNGGVMMVADDADLPDDGNPCTTDTCTAGVPGHTNLAAGASCGGGMVCDANANCVGCVQDADCGADTACKKFTCNAGTCGSTDVPAGTVATDPTPGDCHTDQCDGNGGVTTNVIDDSDTPDDSKQCTTDACNNGTPSNTPVASGTACTDNGGSKCNSTGTCVQCLAAADCGTDTACKTFTCIAGMCGQMNTAAGTAVNDPTPGDCKSNQCDGNGNIALMVDNNDLPNDSKQCTTDTCVAGAPTFTPVASGTTCTDNGGAKCDAAGTCVQCLAAADCGADTACRTFTCTAGVCGHIDAAAGAPAGNPTVGDCHSDQCDGSGGITANVVDNTDVPADDNNQCTIEVCTLGVGSHQPAPQGTSCNQGGGSVCDGAGTCGACTLDTECPAGGPCQVPQCNAGVCGFTAAMAGTLPPALQVAGDCQVLSCDGTSQTPVSAADDADLPPDDGNDCTQDTCSGGMVQHPALPADTTCSTGGGVKCDGAGNCVTCTAPTDCPAAANECQTATCTGGACGFNNAAAGTVTSSQTAGDCQQNQCDGNGAIVSVALDTDVPDDSNPCTIDACSSGSPSFTNAALGTACGGNNVCDGNGACVTPPSVSSTTPSDAGSGLAGTHVAVTFSQAMNTTTLTAQTASGACSGSIQVSLDDFTTCVAFASAAPAMTSSNTVATLIPQPGLLVNRTYKIRVTTAATNAGGVPLQANYTSATGFGTTNPLANQNSGVVISQVYGGGGNTGATYKNDFIVLHNLTAAAVNLTGWSVQYASATGTSWNVTSLTGSIAAGGYYLVQEAAGTGGTTALPTPDATGTAAMSATAGKVALVNSTTALSGACPTGAQIIDLVGFGANASCYEGAGPTIAPSNTASVTRFGTCADSNVNSADFAPAVPSPRNTASTAMSCAPAQNESGASGEADYCTTQFPLSLSVQAGMMSPTVYGQIYEMNVTEAMGASASVTAQLGYGPATANPEYEPGWIWSATTYNVQSGNNDEYQAMITAPMTAGSYRYAYRFSLDGGTSWTYCDNNQADGGAGSNPNLAFDLENLGVLTVTP